MTPDTSESHTRRAGSEAASARLVSVNIGAPREIEWRGRTFKTAIWKDPTPGRVPVTRLGLAGDHQADHRVHGGPDMAIYAYDREDELWWEAELHSAVPPGTFGENLTLAGIAVGEALVGERWRVGTALVRVTKPRMPCWKLGVRMGDQKFPARFAAAEKLGCYLAVVEEGEVEAGDPVEVIDRPTHPVSMRLLAHLGQRDPQLGVLLLRMLHLDEAPLTADSWDQLLRTAGIPIEYWCRWAEQALPDEAPQPR